MPIYYQGLITIMMFTSKIVMAKFWDERENPRMKEVAK
jgi:hypothetical protein